MGARTLRSFVEQPLIDADAINERLDAVTELNMQAMLREEIREYLNPYMTWNVWSVGSVIVLRTREICWHLKCLWK